MGNSKIIVLVQQLIDRWWVGYPVLCCFLGCIISVHYGLDHKTLWTLYRSDHLQSIRSPETEVVG